jgi:DNA replication protein DnaC
VSDPIGDPNCPSCGGAGWVRVADGGVGAAKPCDCSKKARLGRNLLALGIPPRYQRATLDNFRLESGSRDSQTLLEAVQACRRYIAGFQTLEGRPTSRGLLFIGAPGAGKTHLAIATLRSIVSGGPTTGRFLDFTSFVSDLQATFDPSSPDSKHDLLDPVLETGLLVLDDLGAREPTPFVHELLYLIVNTRYANQRPTIFTTNLQLETSPVRPKSSGQEPYTEPQSFDQSARSDNAVHLLSKRLQPLLVSRLYEMTELVLISASDYRKKRSSFRERIA